MTHYKFLISEIVDGISNWWLGFDWVDYILFAVFACTLIYYKYQKVRMLERYKYQHDVIGRKNFNLEKTLQWAEKTFKQEYKPKPIYAFYNGRGYVKKYVVRKYKDKLTKQWSEWETFNF